MTASSFPPQVAGMFYPKDPQTLRATVDELLTQAAPCPLPDDEDLVGVLAPHAGYPYSGPVAAAAYRCLEGRRITTVVILALSHRRRALHAAILDAPSYATPLGPVIVDGDMVRDILRRGGDAVAKDNAPFAEEHSLEVQLPFIQRVLPMAMVVPIIVAVDDDRILRATADALYGIASGRNDVAFVVSSDLSHFHPYSQAQALDRHVLSLLQDWKLDAWREAAERTSEGMCGVRPMTVFTYLFDQFPRKDRAVHLIRYANSGDTAGDKSRVVGYAAMAFTLKKPRPAAPPDARFGPYGKAERRVLMDIAHKAVEAAAHGRRFTPQPPDSDVLRTPGAAFVTLKKDGQLRGCIGHVTARLPLYQCVAEVAKAAAVQDPRFAPVTPDELPQLSYEISILTPPVPITPDKVEVGRHGLIASRGGHTGLLLPQVPIEWGWNREEFLAHTCRKAGLPMSCWNDPGTSWSAFEAIVFDASDL